MIVVSKDVRAANVTISDGGGSEMILGIATEHSGIQVVLTVEEARMLSVQLQDAADRAYLRGKRDV